MTQDADWEEFPADRLFEELKASFLRLKAGLEDVYGRMKEDEKRERVLWLKEEVLRRTIETLREEEPDVTLVDGALGLMEPLLARALEEVFGVALDEPGA